MEPSESTKASGSDASSLQRAEEFTHADPPRTLACASSDGVVFHVDRVVLQGTSGFFRDMLSLPQTDASQDSPDALIKMHEPASVLNPFFLLVHGKNPHIDSLSHLDEVAFIALKYDAGLALLALRSELRAFAQEDPLNAYAIAGRFEWEKEAIYISSLTHDLCIFDMEPSNVKRVPVAFYQRLVKLHMNRLRTFAQIVHNQKLDQHQFFFPTQESGMQPAIDG